MSTAATAETTTMPSDITRQHEITTTEKDETTTTTSPSDYDSNNNNNNGEKWLLERTGLTTKNDLTALTKLNLPNCGLSTESLPSDLPTVLPNLSILFLPKNNFEELPPILGACPKLQMISFKDNGMKQIHPEALQPQLRWLILTGNAITELPETIGRCKRLQKLMLSGNQLSSLPKSIHQLEGLELIRLACNQLQEPPLALLQLQNLRWIALSNNPFLEEICNSKKMNCDNHLTILDDPLLEDDQWPILGQGAGGITRQVTWNTTTTTDNNNDDDKKGLQVAVKTFSGTLTSDGSPQDERAISVTAASLQDPSLIRLFGQTAQTGALVMEFLKGYHALAGPPSFDTCSRDVYYNCDKDGNKDESNGNDDKDNYKHAVFMAASNEDFAWMIVTNLLRVLYKLHFQAGICHGDFYAHNILISPSSSTAAVAAESAGTAVKLSDFGAAFFYDTNAEYGKYIQQIELRSYRVLVEELQSLLVVAVEKSKSKKEEEETTVVLKQPWAELVKACQEKDATFETLAKQFVVEGNDTTSGETTTMTTTESGKKRSHEDIES